MAPTKSTFSWHCTHTHKFAFFTIETTLLHPICDVMYVTSRKKVSKVYFIGLSYFYSSLYTFISRLKDEFGNFFAIVKSIFKKAFFFKKQQLDWPLATSQLSYLLTAYLQKRLLLFIPPELRTEGNSLNAFFRNPRDVELYHKSYSIQASSTN